MYIYLKNGQKIKVTKDQANDISYELAKLDELHKLYPNKNNAIVSRSSATGRLHYWILLEEIIAIK